MKLKKNLVKIEDLSRISSSIAPKSERQVSEEKSLLTHKARLLSKAVVETLGCDLTERFLETVYLPIVTQFSCYSVASAKSKLEEECPQNLFALWSLSVGTECRGDADAWPNYSIESIDCDIALPFKPNLYERAIFLFAGIRYSQLKVTNDNKAKSLTINRKARLSLAKNLERLDSWLASLVELIPLTLFEGLEKAVSSKPKKTPRMVWLGPWGVESYLFSVAHARERNAFVFGQAHGGGYHQFEYASFAELTERALSHSFPGPTWDPVEYVLPNLRLSRNRFIAKKFFFKTRTSSKLLVLLGYFYLDTDPRSLNNVTGDDYQNEYYEKQLKTLGAHFDDEFDFKLHPRQYPDKVVRETLNYLKEIYPSSDLLMCSKSVMELSHRYRGVIHIDTWGTAVMELAASNVKQYVFINEDLRLSEAFKLFLWNSRKFSSREHYKNGAYILVDNLKFREAYSASLLYPLQYARFIKKFRNFNRVSSD